MSSENLDSRVSSAEDRRARLRQAISDKGLTQKETETRAGLSVAYLSKIFNGQKDVSPNVAMKCARVLDVRAEWLISGEGPKMPLNADQSATVIQAEDMLDQIAAKLGYSLERRSPPPSVVITADQEEIERLEGSEQFVAVPFAADAASAGHGHLMEDEIAGYVVLHASVARDPAKLVGVRINGDSMMPTLPDGSIVAVQRDSFDPADLVGKIVCARTNDGQVVIKRLAAANAHIVLESDNEAYQPIVVDTREQPNPIIGKVRCAWVDLD